ncbi:MAG TPA: dTMP kinase [Burkholderiales bacterium]|jgi:dTMP kinase
MTRGRFITLEGVDGAGKSTHQKFIADLAATRAPHVVQTREPGGTDLAERLRESILKTTMTPEVETLLIFAARADHVAKVIRPALDTGQWVVCDRFTDATYAYQGAGKGVSLELIGRLGDVAHPGLRPDRTLVFDCPYEVARKRLQGKTLDRFEREDREFFERVRNHYLVRARADGARMRVIDATMELDQIRKSIEGALAGL